MSWYRKLLIWGFNQNSWVWFHILAGGLLAKFFGLWIVIILALGWEVVEFLLDCKGSFKKCKEIYGSVERWAYDSIGDIIGAIACALIVIW